MTSTLDRHQRTSCAEAQWCEHCPCECGEPWPCATRRALDPDQETTR